jgi:hypothetical protein
MTPPIGKIKLTNYGTLPVKLQLVYYDLETGEKHHADGSDSIPLGRSVVVDPGDHGVPDGALVTLYAFVVWGADCEDRHLFIYRRGNPHTACYTIGGMGRGDCLSFNCICT